MRAVGKDGWDGQPMQRVAARVTKSSYRQGAGEHAAGVVAELHSGTHHGRLVLLRRVVYRSNVTPA